jgi:hypothetical protein
MLRISSKMNLLRKYKVNKLLILLLTVCFIDSCSSHTSKNIQQEKSEKITASDFVCEGSYVGPEFIEGDDVAHQFSNEMSEKVGDQLKKLYKAGKFAKVDFEQIKMSTKGMGTGQVTYKLRIPLKRVKTKCEAFTSFDHCGGWNHPPAIELRIEQLSTILLPGDKLNISPLKTTPEGLQEYWIQWRNKEMQAECS